VAFTKHHTTRSTQGSIPSAYAQDSLYSFSLRQIKFWKLASSPKSWVSLMVASMTASRNRLPIATIVRFCTRKLCTEWLAHLTRDPSYPGGTLWYGACTACCSPPRFDRSSRHERWSLWCVSRSRGLLACCLCRKELLGKDVMVLKISHSCLQSCSGSLVHQ
jgi:hypothetical protein